MRKDVRKNTLRGLCAVITAAALLSGSMLPAAAAPASADPEQEGVVVLFEGEENLSKSKVRSLLKKGDEAVRVTVEDVWNFEDADMSVALVTSDEDPDLLAAKLERREDVKYAEKDFVSHMMSVTNDTYSDLQWSMQPGSETPNVQSAWAKGTTGTSKVVAILDTGVDYTHPELKDNMWINPYTGKGLKGKYGFDFISGDADPMDENGHGSHCAGIIGAMGNNNEGISGVNQSVKIMALRILDERGNAMLSHEIAAYHYINKALDLGVPVVAINNSWGGGGYSRIFETLVEKVGKKGAITVCAAGNEASDFAGYPASIDSPYLLTVAATKEDGELVSFSNHGEWVDLAAPGTDILSSVCYDCYNPRLYADKQAEISQAYNGFEDGSTDLIPQEIYVNGKKLEKQVSGNTTVFTGDKERQVTMSVSGNGFLGGSALSLSFHNVQSSDLICIPIADYTVSGNQLPHLSMMTRGKSGVDASASLNLVEVGADRELTTSGLESGFYRDLYLDDGGDYWGHTDFCGYEGEKEGTKRRFVLALGSMTEGDYTVDIDDLGLSRQDLSDTAVFGKYDFMSGTSMATPFITGAIALKRAQMDKESGNKTEILDLVNEMLSMTKASPQLDIEEQRGSFDFSVPPVRSPRIADVSLKTENGKTMIELVGSAMDLKAADFSLKITKDEKTTTLTSKDVTGDLHKITFADRGWKNNIVDFELTAGGKKAEKKTVYMVKGKKKYATSDKIFPEGTYQTTDGKRLFSFDTYSNAITYTEMSENGASGSCEIPADLFGIEKDPEQKYAFDCKQMVYMNNCIYAIMEYGAADAPETGGDMKIYDGKTLLIRADMDTYEAKAFAMPDLGELEGTALGAYNGKLYLIGGYTVKEGKNIPSTMVKVFDPAKGSWTNGKPLPSGRYCGRALQTGNTLVYTLGYADEEESYGANLLFDGNTWKESKAGRLKVNLVWIDPAVGIMEGGLIYAGMSVEDYGDTFVYDVKADRFSDTGYNLYTSYEDEGPTFVMSMAEGVYAGYTSTSGDNEGSTELMFMPVKTGYVTITPQVNGCGTMTGPSVNPPGNDVRYTLTADEGCYLDSLVVDGKSIALPKECSSYTYVFKNLMKNATINATFKDPWSGEEVPDEWEMGENTLIVSGKKLMVKSKKIGKKGLTIKRKKYLVSEDPGQGTLSFKLASIQKGKKKLGKKQLKKVKKKLKLNAKNGKLTLKKGLKKGTYKLRIKVTAAGDEWTYPVTKTVKVTLKIK